MSTIGAERIEHVTIVVTDLNKARAFYAGVLGLVEVPRPPSFDFPGAWYQIGPTLLHLLGKPQRDSASPRHFCLWVAGVPEAASAIESSGSPVIWEAKHKIPGVDRFFIYDPDGNRIEIMGPEAAEPA